MAMRIDRQKQLYLIEKYFIGLNIKYGSTPYKITQFRESDNYILVEGSNTNGLSLNALCIDMIEGNVQFYRKPF